MPGPDRTGRRPGELLTRVGGVLFVAGVALVLAAFVPALVSGGETNGYLAGLTLVVPSVGLGMLLWGVVRVARAESRAARARRLAADARRLAADTRRTTPEEADR